MTQIDYSQDPEQRRVEPDKRLQRARSGNGVLEWWNSVGPTDFNAKDIYRTAVSVEGRLGTTAVKMPDYRWGIFLHPQEQGRVIGFGDPMEPRGNKCRANTATGCDA
jgi:benzoyl-CoA 2,3-dioxygenase component B